MVAAQEDEGVSDELSRGMRSTTSYGISSRVTSSEEVTTAKDKYIFSIEEEFCTRTGCAVSGFQDSAPNSESHGLG